MPEVRKEALADIKIDRLLANYSIARLGQVQSMFSAGLTNPESVDTGVGSLEIRLFDRHDMRCGVRW